MLILSSSFYLPLRTYSTEKGIEYNCTGKPGHHINQLINVGITWTVTNQDRVSSNTLPTNILFKSYRYKEAPNFKRKKIKMIQKMLYGCTTV